MSLIIKYFLISRILRKLLLDLWKLFRKIRWFFFSFFEQLVLVFNTNININLLLTLKKIIWYSKRHFLINPSKLEIILTFFAARRTGSARPTSGPAGGKRGGSPGGSRARGRPPKGMHINHDDLATMASGNAGTLLLKAMERELDSLQRQVSNKYFFGKLATPRRHWSAPPHNCVVSEEGMKDREKEITYHTSYFLFYFVVPIAYWQDIFIIVIFLFVFVQQS